MGSIDFDKADRERDRELRRLALRQIANAVHYGVAGAISGRAVVNFVNGTLPDDQQFQDDAHAIGLLRYLRDGGYVQERVVNLPKGAHPKLIHVEYRLTARGRQLVDQHIPADPAIADDRAETGEWQ